MILVHADEFRSSVPESEDDVLLAMHVSHVANLFTDNAQQQEEFTRLKERLVEALEAEVNWNFYPLKFCTCVHMQFAI